jgi:hypothetical protein
MIEPPEIPPPADPFAQTLAYVREEESKTHRQRRLTNWLVALLCSATLVVTIVTKIQTSREFNRVVVNQERILVQLHALCTDAQAVAGARFHCPSAPDLIP